jgi:segregation and condensation protein A
VGDFLEMASTLAEIKSRMALPRADEVEEEVDDARQELVQRLLEYKKFRDAATVLDERSRAWQERFTRQADDIPPRKRNLADEPIHELEIWDLVSALARTMREHAAVKPANIVYDDTPIHVYMQRIHTRLVTEEKVAFSQMFQAEMHKSALVGLFLAMMELIRHHGVQAQQEQLFGEIWLCPGEQTRGPVDFSHVDNYEHAPAGTNEEDAAAGEDAEKAGQDDDLSA